jgi:phage tail-like protein
VDANGSRYHLLLGERDWADCYEIIRTNGSELRRTLHHLLKSDPTASPLTSPLAPPSTLAFDEVSHELTLRQNLTLLVTTSEKPRLVPEQRRGADRDRYGNWYWIDENGTEIKVRSSGTSETTHFWSATDRSSCQQSESIGEFGPAMEAPPIRPRALCGLGVTEDHYLVAGTVSPAALLVFDLHSGGPPRELSWPDEIAFAPFDMAARPGGGVWILDRIHRRYWEIDRYFRPLPAGADVPLPISANEFMPVSGEPICQPRAQTFPAGHVLSIGSPVDAVDPIAIEALPDGTVLVLDRNAGQKFSRILRYSGGQRMEVISLEVITEMLEHDRVESFTLTAHDFAFVPTPDSRSAAPNGRLLVVGDDGEQAFAIALQWVNHVLEVTTQPQFLPLRLFRGKALVEDGGSVYYDFADRWIRLVEQKRPRYAPEGILETPLAPVNNTSGIRPAFDGREPGCVWHRILIDACLPDEAQIRVSSRAADDADLLEKSNWVEEPRLYRRSDGSEIPFSLDRSGGHAGTWELLLQRARGRYLQLRLHLTGNGRSTPRIRALRVYYPRFSYLRYLPAIYREDDSSLLERLLANPEGIFTATEDRISAVDLMIDPDSAPASALAWLASWFDLALDPTWDDHRRRLMIRHALKFFQYRGTVRGIEAAVRLALDPCVDDELFEHLEADLCSRRSRPVRVVEQFRSRAVFDLVEGRAARWKPDDGSEALHQRWTEFTGGKELAPFPLRPETKDRDAWLQFCRSAIGFVPSAGAGDVARWRDFLARAYGRIANFNLAHGTNWKSFAELPLPIDLPAAPAALRDWYRFESVVLVTANAAHRFTVLLPAPRRDSPDRHELRRRLDLASRVVAHEKPAHTVFDVHFYWDYFRVGFARLGDDSVIDRGSRSVELNPPALLGEQYVGGSFLAPGHPFDVTDRTVLGRDRLGHGWSPTETSRE